jgi:hypothetical protein
MAALYVQKTVTNLWQHCICCQPTAALYRRLLPTYGSTVSVTNLWQHCIEDCYQPTAALYLLPTYGSTIQMTVTTLWQHCTERLLLSFDALYGADVPKVRMCPRCGCAEGVLSFSTHK